MFVYLLHNSRPIQQKHLAHVLEDCAWTMTTSIAYMTVSYFAALLNLFQLFVSFFISFSFHFLCLASYKGVKAFNSLNPPPTNFKNQVHANTFDEKDSFEFSTVTIEPDYNFEFDTEAAEDIMTTTTGFKRISQVLLLMMLMEKHVFCRLL